LLLVFCTAGCGSDRVTGPSPSTPYSESVVGTVSTFGTTRHALTIPRAGELTVRLTWETPGVDLDLYLAPATCTSLYPVESCGVIAASDAASGLSEQISRTVSSGQSFSLFVDNLSLTQPQAYNLSISIR
jgi:hypothetical protein